VGFEPAIPMFERANTVYALDRAATVIGSIIIGVQIIVQIECPVVLLDALYHLVHEYKAETPSLFVRLC
jgi:hypothetical protein